MRRTMQRMLAAATLTLAALGTSLVAAGPASAAPPSSCWNDHICLYQHINFNRNSDGWMTRLHVDYFYNCGLWVLSDNRRNRVSSVYNNTDAHLQLWDTDPNPDYLVGTAVRRKGYTYLGARGNDATDLVVGVGCK